MNDPGWLLSDVLCSVTRFVSRRPKLTLAWVAALTAVAIGVTVSWIEFKTDRADLIDPETPFQKRWLNYTETFGEASDMVVVVEADDPHTIKQVIDDLGSRMDAEPESFRNVLYKIEPGDLAHKGLQYLDPQQLDAVLQGLEHYRPIAQGEWDRIRLDSLCDRLRLQIEDRLKGGTADGVRALLHQTALLATSLQRFLADVNDFQNPWPDLVPLDPRMREEASQVTYFLNDQGTMGFLKAFPATTSENFAGPSESIDRLRSLIADVTIAYPDARIGLTGIPVLENDEMRKSQADMLKASLVSVVGVGLLLCLGFRGIRHPLLALVMLAVGMAWAFGYTTLSVGHLNILSVSFAAILIGLGIDFGIHYLARYLELRHQGYSLRPALLDTSSGVGTGIVTAAVTTALAFFCAMVTQFRGVAELGVIAGGGILLCGVATFVVLPALVSLADGRVEPRKLPTPFEGQWLRWATSRYPIAVILCSVVLVVLIARPAVTFRNGWPKLNVDYDHNLLNLQAEGLESVEVQKRVFAEPQGSSLFAVSVADTPDEARALRKRFEVLPSVHHVEELASRLPSEPPSQTLLRIQGIASELAWLGEEPPKFDLLDPAETGRALEKLHSLVRQIDDPPAIAAARSLDAFLETLDEEDFTLQRQVVFLNEYQHRMAAVLLGQFRGLVDAASAEPVCVADLPPELTSRFVSSQGKWLVQVYPKDAIWDFEPLSQFVHDVRTVDREVTGTPLQNFEASQQIMDSYETAALYALAVICLVLLADFLHRKSALIATMVPLVILSVAAAALHAGGSQTRPAFYFVIYLEMVAAIALILDFRSPSYTVLALLPPLAGGVLMFGILAALDVALNPANLVVLPLILGIGVDDGVHVIHDYRMQQRRYRMSSSTMNAIVLTSFTSMIGFGSMMLAAHRGLSSLGLVLVVGVGSCLFVSLVPLPAVLTLISRIRDRTAQLRTRPPRPHAPQRRSRARMTSVR